MAKVSFTKLGLKPNTSMTIVEFNDQSIEVKQYLPVEEKLEIITHVLENSHDQNNFSNPIKVQVYTALEILEKYTNISFTEKQKENPTKLYDMINGNGLLENIVGAIPQIEYDELIHGIYDTIDAVYKFENSVLGILEAMSQDYNNINFDINKIQEVLTDPNQISTLKGLAEISGLYNEND